MAPLIKGFEGHKNIRSVLCVTGQHREMLDQVLRIYAIKPDFDLDLMKLGQTLSQLTSSILLGLEPILDEVKPDWVFVHGDTASTAAASLAAYYKSIRVAHVEAGLRTYDIYSPWPEEINRRIAGVIASCHFAPTETAKSNLLAESVKRDSIAVTGNTVIDALYLALKKIESSSMLSQQCDEKIPRLDPDKKLVVVTGHRRESFGEGFENICNALLELSNRDDVQIIYPVHLNPYVKKVVTGKLSGQENIHLIEPLDYLSFIRLLSRAYIIISDSGGIQEEAPSLGIPLLVTRETTERPEVVDIGAVKLVGHDKGKIVTQAVTLLENPSVYAAMSNCKNPYGDGRTVERIINHLLKQSI